MTARVLWTALMVLVGVVAAGAQLDRQSRRDPALAMHVPEPFRGYAGWTTALRALDAGDADLALREAQALVRRRPVPGENLTVLAQVRQARGEDEMTVRTILLAGTRGWRSAPLQQTVLAMAHDAGDDAEAARRLAALWATGADLSGVRKFTDAVLSTPAGLETFAGQVAATNTWQTGFLRSGAVTLGGDLHARVIKAASDRGAQFDCQLLSGAAQALADAGRARPAADLWTRRCAVAAYPAEAPGTGFAGKPQSTSGPFDWHYPDGQTVRLDFGQGRGGWIINFENSSLARQTLARRRTALAPGKYALVLTAQSGDSALLTEIACAGPSGLLLARRPGSGEHSFIVPAADCPVQRIAIHAFPGAGTGLQVELRSQ